VKTASPRLVFALLISLTFTLATSACLRAINRPEAVSSDGAFKKLLGDGRRLFSGQFVEMADVYLHSGYYPSIFDRRDAGSPKAVTVTTPDDKRGHENHQHDAQGRCVESESHEAHEHDESGKCVHPDEPQDEHEKAMSFLGQPRDWLEGFIRRFRITRHTHLENGQEREVLPWLKLAIELDPQAIETYTATAYWLRKNLGNTKDAEEVLREGLRNNPGSFEILFELGKLHNEAHHDAAGARNRWLAALRQWNQQTAEAKTANVRPYGEITVNLARLETDAGNWEQAIRYFELAKPASPRPEAIQQQIDDIRTRTGSPATSAPSFFPIP
jgi:tetratricopeptide (TPR) repeat protein